MKTFNRYIFTVICNINGENCKILINTFIIRNDNNDGYISDNVEKYIDCKFTNAVTKNLKLYNDNVLKWNDKNYDNFELVYKEK